MSTLQGKRLFITGASRGIGRAIALRAAKDGAFVTIAAKTAEPHAKLAGTIFSVAEEIEAAGGKAFPFQLDVREDAAVVDTFRKAADAMGGIDILVNNASAINLTPTLQTPMKRFDLMFGVNVRATFACSQAAIPYLQESAKAGRNPHILTLSPPLSMKAKWFAPHLAYTMSKYGMSMCVLGLAEELAADGIAANALWPLTTIATAAIEVHFPPELIARSRNADIMADAAHAILVSDARKNTGHFYIDEDVLRAAGVTDFAKYAVQPGMPLTKDLFLD